MSKPKHRMRGMGRHIGHGYYTTDMIQKKGVWGYVDYLTNEIEDIKHRGGAHIAKLRKYLKRAS